MISNFIELSKSLSCFQILWLSTFYTIFKFLYVKSDWYGQVTHRIIEYTLLYTRLYSILCYIRQEINAREKLQYIDKNPDDTKSHRFTYSAHATLKKELPLFVPPRLLVFVLPASRSVSNSITNSTSGRFLFRFVFFYFSSYFCYNIIFSTMMTEQKLNLRKIIINKFEYQKVALSTFTQCYAYRRNFLYIPTH